MKSFRSNRGSALIVVLWSVVVLSTMVYSSLRVTRLDLRITKNFGDRVQARYLALAGIEKSKALIYDVRSRGSVAGENYQNELYDNSGQFRDVELGRGLFRVIRGRHSSDDGLDAVVYGILDEERFLDVNRAATTEIAKLPDMEPELVSLLADWRDGDSKVSDGGAEEEYYADLRPPRLIRNGPFETVRELLMVKDMPQEALFGEDLDADGILDPNERDGDRSFPMDNGDGELDGGWAQYLTTESSTEDLDRYGVPRIDLNTADVEDLELVDGIDSNLAEAIVAWRDHRSIASVADLLDVEELVEDGTPSDGNKESSPNLNDVGRNSNPNDNEANSNNATKNGEGDGSMRGTGVKLVDVETLVTVADHLTIGSRSLRENIVNINTCDPAVLLCLPGMDEDLVHAIIDHREASQGFESTAALLEVDGVDKEIFKKIAPRIDVRSGTFRILCEGIVPSTNARQRILVTIRMGEFEVETLSYREDL